MVKRLLIIVGALLALIVAAFVGLVLATAGDYSVPPTVSDDPDLPSVTLGGVTFHAETYGDPANPTIIVLHGGPGGDYAYLLSLSELADTYHVVFYDQRGAGLSERVPAEELTIQSSIDDLDRIIEHYSSDDPVILIGHSWGAMLASGYVGQHPERVSRAVLAEPGALSSVTFERWLALQQSVQDAAYAWASLRTGFEAQHVDGPDEHAADDYLIGTMAHYWVEQTDNPYLCPGSSYEAPYWRFGAAAYNALFDAANDFDQLGPNGYRGEVLFVASGCNTWLGEDFQREQMAAFPNAELVVIPGVGHDMFTEAPAASIPPVRAFLDR